MHCPYCKTAILEDTIECPTCHITYPKTLSLVGIAPRLGSKISDHLHYLSAGDFKKLHKRITRLETTFPQVVVQVVINHFPSEHPFSMHAFWLFNVGNFAGDSFRGRTNRAILLAIDPKRCEAAIVPGYGLEQFLTPEPLDHLLELASPDWQAGLWGAGIIKVIDGIDQLLELVATFYHPEELRPGTY